MTTRRTPPAHTFETIKNAYKTLLEEMYAQANVDADMRQRARELYVDAQFMLSQFAFEMRMTSIERREAQGKIKQSGRADEELVAELQSAEHRIWRNHMVMDAQYVALSHIARGLHDGFLLAPRPSSAESGPAIN